MAIVGDDFGGLVRKHQGMLYRIAYTFFLSAPIAEESTDRGVGANSKASRVYGCAPDEFDLPSCTGTKYEAHGIDKRDLRIKRYLDNEENQ